MTKDAATIRDWDGPRRAVGAHRRKKGMVIMVELRTLAYGLAAFLISAVVLTLLGDGAGNTTGLLFWAVVAILAIAYAVSRFRNGEHEAVRVARWLKHRDGR